MNETTQLRARLRAAMDAKTKPLGALGRLEALAIQLGMIQGGLLVRLAQPQLLVFAADHGLAAEGVSAYPAEVTRQMVANMQSGGAAVNVLALQMGFAMHLVNAGLASAPIAVAKPQVNLIDRSLGFGTANSLHSAALTPRQLEQALAHGAALVDNVPGNVLALGEMGIGNSSAAALLLSRLAGVPITQAIGRGTGLNDAQLAHKCAVLTRVLERHAHASAPMDVMAAFGGFEMAMMTGAVLRAAELKRVLLVDGFIAGASVLVANALKPEVLACCVFSHRSAEAGAQALLAALGAEPLFDLGLRLGEGTGALLAWPLVQSAANLLNDMATFDSAHVSQAS